jgi:hypothetical protein
VRRQRRGNKVLVSRRAHRLQSTSLRPPFASLNARCKSFSDAPRHMRILIP